MAATKPPPTSQRVSLDQPRPENDHRALGSEDGDVLGQVVIEDVRLNQVEDGEEGVDSQGEVVDEVKPTRIAKPPPLGM